MSQRVADRKFGVPLALFGAVRQVVAKFASSATEKDLVGARATDRLIAPQSLRSRRGIGVPQTFRERRGVFDRLGRALRKKGQHGVGGVAEKSDSTMGPRFERRAVIERPAFRVRRREDQLMEANVPAREFLEEVRDLTLGRPRFGPPFAGRRAGPSQSVCTGRRAISGAFSAGTRQRKAQSPEKRGAALTATTSRTSE